MDRIWSINIGSRRVTSTAFSKALRFGPCATSGLSTAGNLNFSDNLITLDRELVDLCDPA
jgi:hypothetical protein